MLTVSIKNNCDIFSARDTPRLATVSPSPCQLLPHPSHGSNPPVRIRTSTFTITVQVKQT